MPTNHSSGERPGEYAPPASDPLINYPEPGKESLKVGYETTDVHVGNIIVFLAGLFGFVLIFFVFCFGMGKVINSALEKQDGPVDKFHQPSVFAGAAKGGKREDLKSTDAMKQVELQSMTAQFPNPRLDIDDGNQATADLHAKEDLLLEHYSSNAGEPGIRIPIERAMELIAQKGLPVSSAAPTSHLAGDETPVVQAPLTSGFARTGYELDTIEAREQKMNYGKAEAEAHPEKK
jgi:hypothetical protein